jgi:hypothetical protein
LQDAAKLGTGVLKGPAVDEPHQEEVAAKKRTRTIPRCLSDASNGSGSQAESYRVDPWNFYPDPTCGDDHQNGAYVFEREFMPGRELAKMAKVPGYNWQAISLCLAEGPQHMHSTARTRTTCALATFLQPRELSGQAL